ncbi:MAG TPA: hypothetical protein VEG60_12040 [Candidatus Binatia bacterium]|nr:hypothetical protein [Candidatus Binatia bacterium]
MNDECAAIEREAAAVADSAWDLAEDVCPALYELDVGRGCGDPKATALVGDPRRFALGKLSGR